MAKEKEPEKLRKLAEFKSRLEKKITDTQTELENLRILLDHVDQTLLDQGFKRANLPKPKSRKEPPPPRMEYETIVPLKTVNGDILANLYIGEGFMRVSTAEDKRFNVKTPPFQQFLVERVLNKMQEKDRTAAANGELRQQSIFSYELVLDGDRIREIMISNLTKDRQRELTSSIHWTLEKMYEKSRGASGA